MLRAATRQQIVEKLETSYFGVENYAADFQASGDLLVKIRFIPDARFAFELYKSSNGFITTEAPGERFLIAEDFDAPSTTIILNRISRWADRIHEELISANPFSREVSELRVQLDSRLAQLGEELNGFFTKDEAQDLDERLAAFEKKLAELSDKNKELEESVGTLSQAVKDLRDSVTTLNRGTWFRMSGGRLLSGLKAMATSKETRDFALDAARKFLLEGPK